MGNRAELLGHTAWKEIENFEIVLRTEARWPIYGVCAWQLLTAVGGRDHTIGPLIIVAL